MEEAGGGNVYLCLERMALPKFRNIYKTAQYSACKGDKGVQLKIQVKTASLGMSPSRVAAGSAQSRLWTASCFLFLTGELGW